MKLYIEDGKIVCNFCCDRMEELIKGGTFVIKAFNDSLGGDAYVSCFAYFHNDDFRVNFCPFCNTAIVQGKKFGGGRVCVGDYGNAVLMKGRYYIVRYNSYVPRVEDVPDSIMEECRLDFKDMLGKDALKKWEFYGQTLKFEGGVVPEEIEKNEDMLMEVDNNE